MCPYCQVKGHMRFATLSPATPYRATGETRTPRVCQQLHILGIIVLTFHKTNPMSIATLPRFMAENGFLVC